MHCLSGVSEINYTRIISWHDLYIFLWQSVSMNAICIGHQQTDCLLSMCRTVLNWDWASGSKHDITTLLQPKRWK